MPLFRPAIAAGLVMTGLNVLTATMAIQAVAAECPCIQIGNSCIPDPACDTRRAAQEQQLRQRPKTLQPAQALPGDPAGSPSPRPLERRGGALPPAPPPPVVVAPPPPAAPPAAGGAPAASPAQSSSSDVGRAPAAANGRSTSTGSKPTARPRILETGYSHLMEFGKEAEGYGLYSYAILPMYSERATQFLGELFRSVPSIKDTSARPDQLNIFYVPLLKEKEVEYSKLLESRGGDPTKLAAEYGQSFYDYRMARALLNHVCNPPDDSLRDLCSGGLSGGPYLLTYAAPASQMEPLPPPFLFVDLSLVEARGFAELLDAFKAQVKREDISDRARIDTLRLKVLQYVMQASVTIGPVEEAVGKIIHAVFGGGEKK
jgi:hypothetical protein